MAAPLLSEFYLCIENDSPPGRFPYGEIPARARRLWSVIFEQVYPEVRAESFGYRRKAVSWAQVVRRCSLTLYDIGAFFATRGKAERLLALQESIPAATGTMLRKLAVKADAPAP